MKAPTRSDSGLQPDVPEEADIVEPYHVRTGRIPCENGAIRGRTPIVHGPRAPLSVSKPGEAVPVPSFMKLKPDHKTVRSLYVTKQEEFRRWIRTHKKKTFLGGLPKEKSRALLHEIMDNLEPKGNALTIPAIAKAYSP